jgi:Putative bacterial sensory transduction regulator
MCARRPRAASPAVPVRVDLRYPAIVTALFANHRETNLISAVALVEQVLGDLGYPPADHRVGEPGASHVWRLITGSAITRVAVTETAKFPHLRISAVVMTLDATVDRAALFGHLLELNAGLCGVAFAADGDHVLLVSERPTLDLDDSEVRDAIERVTAYADAHDDALVARFGGRLGASPAT